MASKQSAVLAVIGSTLAVFWPGVLTYGYPGMMAPYWEKSLGVSKGTIGNCVFLALPMVGIFMFVAGKLQERYGTRWMIRIGSVLSSLAALAAAYASNIYMVAVWAAGSGLAVSLVYVPALTTAQRWYPHRKGMVTGIVSLAFGGAAVIGAPVCAHLLKALGYKPMNLTVAVAAFVVGLAAAQFTESPKSHEEAPISCAATAPGAYALSVQEALRTRSFWFLWGTWALQGAAGVCMFTYSVMFGISRGFPYGRAVLLLTCFNLTSGLSRVIAAYLSDLIGRTRLLSLSFVAASAAYLAMTSVTSLAGLCALAMVVGFSFGGMFSVSAPLAADCFGLKHFGAIFGLVFTAYGFIGGALGSSLAGYALDLTGSFRIVFTCMAGFSLVSGAMIRFVALPTQAHETAKPAEAAADPA